VKSSRAGNSGAGVSEAGELAISSLAAGDPGPMVAWLPVGAKQYLQQEFAFGMIARQKILMHLHERSLKDKTARQQLRRQQARLTLLCWMAMSCRLEDVASSFRERMTLSDDDQALLASA